jgi:metallo-beta-lactamase class B
VTGRSSCMLASGVAIALSAGAAEAEDKGDMDLAKKHLAAAEEAAGDDLKAMLGNCDDLGSQYVIPEDKLHGALEKFIGQGGLPPAQVFDNLYFVGAKWVSAWAVKTSEGIILIDALNNADEVKAYVEPGLREFGMDPADIEKVIVTHAHGDHYGGANYLHETYGSEIILSEADWKELEKPELQYDDELWGRPPERGTAVNDGDEVTLGDTSLEILETPGHTPGTVSVVIPIRDGDEEHKAILWGGNGFNFGRDPERFRSYVGSAARVAELAESEGIDVFLSNHSGLDGTEAKTQQLASRGEGEPHPYVIGVPNVQRAMTALRECGLANLASFDASALPGG